MPWSPDTPEARLDRLESLDVIRPAYSADGRRALVFVRRSNFWPAINLPNGRTVEGRWSGGTGYKLLERGPDGWIVTASMPMMIYN